MSETARSSNTTWAKAAQKPDPTAVVAKTEGDYHKKAERLRRTNEKIAIIERCISTDTGDEVEIRERIIESERVFTDTEQRRAELDGILRQARETMENAHEEMRKIKAQRREYHSVELRQLLKEQAAGFEELKRSEVAHHAELTQKIEQYKKNAQPQKFTEKKGSFGPVMREQVLPPLDSCSDEHWLLVDIDGKAARDATSDADDDHLVSLAKKRAAKVEAKGATDKAKRVCKDPPSKRE